MVKRNLNGKQPNLSLQFKDLEYGHNYKICVNIGIQTFSYSWDKCNNKQQPTKCETVSTHCENLPSPVKLPKQIIWQQESDFNPFTQIKVEMEERTFDGEKSGLHQFKIK